jgi:hypothetical protein
MDENAKIGELFGRIEERVKHSVRSGIVTFVTENWQQVFDVDAATLIWGYDKIWRPLLLAKLANALELDGSLVGITVRTFTNQHEIVRAANGKMIRVPVKEIRCYRIRRIDGRLEIIACSKAETFDAHNTDALTGEPIPPESAVIYCDA